MATAAPEVVMTTILGLTARAARTISFCRPGSDSVARSEPCFLAHTVADSGNHEVRAAGDLGHPAHRIPFRPLPQKLHRGAHDALEVFQA